MTDKSNPHLTDDFSPLDEIIARAIRRFGDFSPASVNGDVENMFIEFANAIIDDYKQHPYYDGRSGVDYYISGKDKRAVPDPIILNGLIAYYSFQQSSEKTQGYQAIYFRSMNQIMWKELNGNTAINIRPTDGGSNKEHSVETNVTNGLPVTEEDG